MFEAAQYGEKECAASLYIGYDQTREVSGGRGASQTSCNVIFSPADPK